MIVCVWGTLASRTSKEWVPGPVEVKTRCRAKDTIEGGTDRCRYSLLLPARMLPKPSQGRSSTLARVNIPKIFRAVRGMKVVNRWTRQEGGYEGHFTLAHPLITLQTSVTGQYLQEVVLTSS